MGKYTNDAKELLHLVGGRENIAAVSHCITRMRFVLNDPKKADIQKIEAMKVVKGSFTQAGQFQVIIGNTVSDFYNDFTAVAGIEGVSKDAVKSAAKQNQNVAQRIMTALAEIFAPLIPAIIVGGLISGFRNCIDIVGWGMELSGGQKQWLSIACVHSGASYKEVHITFECYDPAAGTGTLLMALAHQIGEDRCTIFAQDRSQKSDQMRQAELDS